VGLQLVEAHKADQRVVRNCDVLASQDHHEHLLATIPGARRQERRGGHVLSDPDLAAIYDWLAHRSR